MGYFGNFSEKNAFRNAGWIVLSGMSKTLFTKTTSGWIHVPTGTRLTRVLRGDKRRWEVSLDTPTGQAVADNGRGLSGVYFHLLAAKTDITKFQTL